MRTTGLLGAGQARCGSHRLGGFGGSIRPDLQPGDLVTRIRSSITPGRKSTYFEGHDSAVVHIDFTEPYDAALRERVTRRRRWRKNSASLPSMRRRRPRSETRRSTAIERDGADVVGMTGMPEGGPGPRTGSVPYAAINVVVNYAAGRVDSRTGIRFSDIEAVLARSMGQARTIIESLVGCGSPNRTVRMGDARLWQRAREVDRFDTPELHALIADMEDTMHAMDGAPVWAAPQIGIGLRVVIRF